MTMNFWVREVNFSSRVGGRRVESAAESSRCARRWWKPWIAVHWPDGDVRVVRGAPILALWEPQLSRVDLLFWRQTHPLRAPSSRRL